jgi:hypothetical protein
MELDWVPVVESCKCGNDVLGFKSSLLGCDTMQFCGRIVIPVFKWYPTTALHGVTTKKTST